MSPLPSEVAGRHPAPSVRSALQAADVPFEVVDHEALDEAVNSPADVARILDLDMGQLAKTLFVAQVPERIEYVLVVLPVTLKADFGAVASVRGWKRASLATPAELASRVGQPVYGVSPIGSPGIPVLMDESLLRHQTIMVGGGREGIEIQLDPRDLARLTTAAVSRVIALRSSK